MERRKDDAGEKGSRFAEKEERFRRREQEMQADMTWGVALAAFCLIFSPTWL